MGIRLAYGQKRDRLCFIVTLRGMLRDKNIYRSLSGSSNGRMLPPANEASFCALPFVSRTIERHVVNQVDALERVQHQFWVVGANLVPLEFIICLS